MTKDLRRHVKKAHLKSDYNKINKVTWLLLWHTTLKEAIVIYLAKVTVKDFKGKYRTDHFRSKEI